VTLPSGWRIRSQPWCFAWWQRGLASPRLRALVAPVGHGLEVVTVAAGRRTARSAAPHVAQVDQPGQPGGRVVLRLVGVGDHRRGEQLLDLCAGDSRVGVGGAGPVVDGDRPTGAAVDQHPAEQGGTQQPDVFGADRAVTLQAPRRAGQLQHRGDRHMHVQHDLPGDQLRTQRPRPVARPAKGGARVVGSSIAGRAANRSARR